MWFYDYSLTQLEKIAEDKLREFDAERLKVPKGIDVYDFIESCLNVPYDWKNLTPNQSLLGFTAFNDGHWWTWDGGKDVLPTRFDVKRGTILIDNSLVAEGAVKGRENFTVIHECFHQILHEKVFKQKSFNYHSYCKNQCVYAKIGKTKPALRGIDITEWQANAAAAALLMPREAVVVAFRETLAIPMSQTLPVRWTLSIDLQVQDIADKFDVSYTAMKYRLFDLGLVEGQLDYIISGDMF